MYVCVCTDANEFAKYVLALPWVEARLIHFTLLQLFGGQNVKLVRNLIKEYSCSAL